MDKVKRILILSDDTKIRDILNFCFDGWGYEVFLREGPYRNDVTAITNISPDVIVIDVQSASKKQLDICRLLKENYSTAFIPIITLINKRHLRAQLLNIKQGIDDYLIKPPDPLDLRIRIEMVIRRAKYSIQASPLTGLPGNVAIEKELERRLGNGSGFVFMYADIDNFKAFNDHYGYRRGDEAIKLTSQIILEAVKNGGSSDAGFSRSYCS